MKFIEQNNKLEQLDQILRQNKTGPAPKIADKMGVCERTVHNLLDILRAFGAKISYNKHRESYSYKNKVNIQFFKVRIENDDEIKGGANFLYFFSSNYYYLLMILTNIVIIVYNFAYKLKLHNILLF